MSPRIKKLLTTETTTAYVIAIVWQLIITMVGSFSARYKLYDPISSHKTLE